MKETTNKGNQIDEKSEIDFNVSLLDTEHSVDDQLTYSISPPSQSRKCREGAESPEIRDQN